MPTFNPACLSSLRPALEMGHAMQWQAVAGPGAKGDHWRLYAQERSSGELILSGPLSPRWFSIRRWQLASETMRTAHEPPKRPTRGYAIMMVSRRATGKYDSMHLLRRKLAITTARVSGSIHRTYDHGVLPTVYRLRGGEMAGFGRSKSFFYDLTDVRAVYDFRPWRAGSKTAPNTPRMAQKPPALPKDISP